jgi:hypothetical protein
MGVPGPGPDQRPSIEQRPVTQEGDGLRYDLPMRLEAGMRGSLVIRWKEDGTLTATVSGPAVRVVNKLRNRDERTD